MNENKELNVMNLSKCSKNSLLKCSNQMKFVKVTWATQDEQEGSYIH